MESEVPVTNSDGPGTSLEQRNVAIRNGFSPKYNLSKIKSKYLILDILFFSEQRAGGSKHLWGLSRAMR